MILEDPALRVLDAISTAGTDRAVLVGHGWGSMVALQIAATRDEQVAALMLSTNARLETIVLRSLYYGILSLLPAAIVQQLGARPPEVLDLLDQVRPADFRSLAERVPAPALVIVGEQDVANRGPSATLARSLPLGNLRVVPHAGRRLAGPAAPSRREPAGRVPVELDIVRRTGEFVARRQSDHEIVAVPRHQRPERGVSHGRSPPGHGGFTRWAHRRARRF